MKSICSRHVRTESINVRRNFVLVVDLKDSVQKLKLKLCRLWGDYANSIATVLLTFTINLFLQDQTLNSSKTLLTRVFISSDVLLDKIIKIYFTMSYIFRKVIKMKQKYQLPKNTSLGKYCSISIVLIEHASAIYCLLNLERSVRQERNHELIQVTRILILKSFYEIFNTKYQKLYSNRQYNSITMFFVDWIVNFLMKITINVSVDWILLNPYWWVEISLVLLCRHLWLQKTFLC